MLVPSFKTILAQPRGPLLGGSVIGNMNVSPCRCSETNVAVAAVVLNDDFTPDLLQLPKHLCLRGRSIAMNLLPLHHSELDRFGTFGKSRIGMAVGNIKS